MGRLPIGMIVDDVTIPVERGKIREFVRATGTRHPVHASSDAADEAGLTDVVTPLTYSVLTAHYRDQAEFVRMLGLDIRRVVVGSVSWEYRRPVLAGQTLRAVRKVESDERREGRSGPMRIVGLVTDFVDEHGDLAIVQRETLIERAAAQ